MRYTTTTTIIDGTFITVGTTHEHVKNSAERHTYIIILELNGQQRRGVRRGINGGGIK
jgi:hypothetical protein